MQYAIYDDASVKADCPVLRRHADGDIEALAVQDLLHRVLCKLRRVVLLREMSEKDVRRALLHAYERPGGIGVGQVAAVRQDAPLERPRIVAVLEHLGVVIGLEDEHVGPVDGLLHTRGHEAEVRRERAARGARDAVTHRVRRIVRDVERVDCQAPDAEGSLDGVEALGGNGAAAAHVLDRRAPREDRQLIPLRERHETRDVIAVLVRDEHAVERGGVNTFCRQPLLDARRADARVEQETHAVHFHIDGIAPAAAGEYRYLHVSSPILTPETVNGLQSLQTILLYTIYAHGAEKVIALNDYLPHKT